MTNRITIKLWREKELDARIEDNEKRGFSLVKRGEIKLDQGGTSYWAVMERKDT